MTTSNQLSCFNSSYDSTKRLRRTLVHVSAVVDEQGTRYVVAMIPAWNPYRFVRINYKLIKKYLGSFDVPTYLFAMVNTGATSEADLIFRDFEIAPEPDDNDGLA